MKYLFVALLISGVSSAAIGWLTLAYPQVLGALVIIIWSAGLGIWAGYMDSER